MSDLTLTLPHTLREFVDEEATAGGFASPEQYVLQLVESARRHKTKRRVDELLREGLNSGPAVEATEEWWAGFRDQCQRQLNEQDPP